MKSVTIRTYREEKEEKKKKKKKVRRQDVKQDKAYLLFVTDWLVCVTCHDVLTIGTSMTTDSEVPVLKLKKN